jgi:hypothetical protein
MLHRKLSAVGENDQGARYRYLVDIFGAWALRLKNKKKIELSLNTIKILWNPRLNLKLKLNTMPMPSQS